MCTTPDEILGTAKRLSASENLTEADSRAIVSRAYYAALHGVNSCFMEQVSTHIPNSHEMIIGKADSHGKSLFPGRTEARQVTRDMYLFKKMRKAADYEIADDFESKEASKALALAVTILDQCNIIKQKLTPSSAA